MPTLTALPCSNTQRKTTVTRKWNPCRAARSLALPLEAGRRLQTVLREGRSTLVLRTKSYNLFRTQSHPNGNPLTTWLVSWKLWSYDDTIKDYEHPTHDCLTPLKGGLSAGSKASLPARTFLFYQHQVSELALCQLMPLWKGGWKSPIKLQLTSESLDGRTSWCWQ